jgi:hypothetical protein
MSVKTFFSKVWDEMEKLFTNGATYEKAIQSVITYAAPIVETIVGLAAGGPAAALVTRVISTVQSDMATVSVVVQQGTVAPGSTAATTCEAALNSIKTNLTSLLTAAEVKNSAKAADITNAVNLIVGEVDAALSGLPTAAAPAAAVVAPKAV